MRNTYARRVLLPFVAIAVLAAGCTTTTPTASTPAITAQAPASSTAAQATATPDPAVEIRERIVYEKTEEAYRANGKIWGERLQEEAVEPGKISYPFLLFLLTGEVDADVAAVDDRFYSPDRSYYFRIHSSLKEAFKEGFREGFVDRKADLVLGPYYQLAAGLIGEANARLFEANVRRFYASQNQLRRETDRNVEQVLTSSVELFKELIAEGSPADREAFRSRFLDHYGGNTEAFLRSRPEYAVDKSRWIRLKFAPDGSVASPAAFEYEATASTSMAEQLWELIYRRSLSEVGQEMGERLVNNLIRREELLEWLRRTRTALDDLTKDIEIIRSGFRETYGRDADTVFNSLLRDIGFSG